MQGVPHLTMRRALVVPAALAVAALLLSSGVASVAMAQSAGPSVKPGIVLVHGAWADGSSWSGVIEQLQADGYQVTAVQLPLSSIEGDVATLNRTLELQTGPTIVVGHSYGGAVMSALGAEAPNVAGLVFVAAFMLDEGESIQALLGSETPPWMANLHPDSAGYLAWDEAGFRQYFAPDVDPELGGVLWAAQKPINAAGFGTVIGPASWRTFPSWYLISDADQLIPPAVQEQLAGRAGSTVAHVDSSHVALVSHPDAVVDLITQAADSISN
jgi:pimeloyl-ACP methyl ester carboxylesterase